MSRRARVAPRLMLLLQESSGCPCPPQIRRDRRPAVGAEASCQPGATAPRGARLEPRRRCHVARWDVPLRPASGEEDGRSDDRAGGLHATVTVARVTWAHAVGSRHRGPHCAADATVTRHPEDQQDRRLRTAHRRHTDGRQDATGEHAGHLRRISGATRAGDRQRRDERRPWCRERSPGASRQPVGGTDHYRHRRRRGGTAPACPRPATPHGVSGGGQGTGGTTPARPGFHQRPLRQHSARGAAQPDRPVSSTERSATMSNHRSAACTRQGPED